MKIGQSQANSYTNDKKHHKLTNCIKPYINHFFSLNQKKSNENNKPHKQGVTIEKHLKALNPIKNITLPLQKTKNDQKT